MQKVLGVLGRNQSSYNISLGQSLTQSKAPTLFSSVEAERGEEAGKKIWIQQRVGYEI